MSHPEKLIVFHDGFRLSRWKDFFVKNGMKNVMLDVHVYLWVLDSFLHLHNLLPYQLLLRFYERQIRRAGRYTPVLVGEWCLCNRVADRYGKSSYEKDEAWRKKGLPEGCADAVKNLGRLQHSRLVLLELPALPRQTGTDVHNEPGQLGPVPLLEPRVDAEEHAVKQ